MHTCKSWRRRDKKRVRAGDLQRVLDAFVELHTDMPPRDASRHTNRLGTNRALFQHATGPRTSKAPNIKPRLWLWPWLRLVAILDRMWLLISGTSGDGPQRGKKGPVGRKNLTTVKLIGWMRFDVSYWTTH